MLRASQLSDEMAAKLQFPTNKHIHAQTKARNKRYGSIALLTFCSNLLTAQPKVYCETYSKFDR